LSFFRWLWRFDSLGDIWCFNRESLVIIPRSDVHEFMEHLIICWRQQYGAHPKSRRYQKCRVTGKSFKFNCISRCRCFAYIAFRLFDYFLVLIHENYLGIINIEAADFCGFLARRFKICSRNGIKKLSRDSPLLSPQAQTGRLSRGNDKSIWGQWDLSFDHMSMVWGLQQ
jgi:hypothetical protein